MLINSGKGIDMIKNWLNIGAVSILSVSGIVQHVSLTSPVAHAASFEVAQLERDMTGECRQVHNDLAMIHQSRTESSGIVMDLSRGDKVILGEDGDLSGWIAVRLPGEGFVQARYLISDCERELPDVRPNLTAPDTLCINYRVSSTVGLNAYELPNPSTDERGRVYPGERIAVVGSPYFSEDTQTEWLRINHPEKGWIENGDPDTRIFNTTLCSELGI
ncbi:hypothetical protein [Spirulina major]|uniref:hypothetical protein n=1 Tax=Spirulina major TaxID=270636 RepID=UPI0009352684|nr:hypothetical protein [Spirulina major]